MHWPTPLLAGANRTTVSEYYNNPLNSLHIESQRNSENRYNFYLQGVTMVIDRLVMGFAGSFILISLLLYKFHSPYWLWFTAFVGANLLQASFTGFCPLANILKFLGFKPGKAFE